jgi:hypothetical protein
MPDAVDRGGVLPEMQLAFYRGIDIPEIRVITDRDSLSLETDIHFGMNAPMGVVEAQPGCPPLTPYLKTLGPRAIDIANRGGRVAEETWHFFNPATYVGEQGYAEVQLVGQPGFRSSTLTNINNWAGSLKTVKEKMSYPYGAKNNKADISFQMKYAPGATTKRDHNGFIQWGTRWSKAELFLALKKYNSVIHFHLDGMFEIYDVIMKLGEYGFNVTSRELRFVFRYWQEFRGHVRFYNGYDRNFNVVEVQCPWQHDAIPPRTKTFAPFVFS